MERAVIRIVEACPDDLSRLYALASKALAYDTFSPELLREKLFFNPHPGCDEYHTLMAELDGGLAGMLQHVIRADEDLAWLGLFAVTEGYRRHKIATRLYEAASDCWRKKGIRAVEVLTIPTNYLVPGIDPRYTPAVCFLESVGFEAKLPKASMRARLDNNFDTGEHEGRLRRQGVEVRRARAEDEELIEHFFDSHFGAGWMTEVRLGMSREPRAVHLALKGGEIIAFAAHSTMNAEWGNGE